MTGSPSTNTIFYSIQFVWMRILEKTAGRRNIWHLILPENMKSTKLYVYVCVKRVVCIHSQRLYWQSDSTGFGPTDSRKHYIPWYFSGDTLDWTNNSASLKFRWKHLTDCNFWTKKICFQNENDLKSSFTNKQVNSQSVV